MPTDGRRRVSTAQRRQCARNSKHMVDAASHSRPATHPCITDSMVAVLSSARETDEHNGRRVSAGGGAVALGAHGNRTTRAPRSLAQQARDAAAVHARRQCHRRTCDAISALVEREVEHVVLSVRHVDLLQDTFQAVLHEEHRRGRPGRRMSTTPRVGHDGGTTVAVADNHVAARSAHVDTPKRCTRRCSAPQRQQTHATHAPCMCYTYSVAQLVRKPVVCMGQHVALRARDFQTAARSHAQRGPRTSTVDVGSTRMTDLELSRRYTRTTSLLFRI